MPFLVVVVLNSPIDDAYMLLQCIAVIANSESLGLPSFVTKYNGKPVLINRSGHCESKRIRCTTYLHRAFDQLVTKLPAVVPVLDSWAWVS